MLDALTKELDRVVDAEPLGVEEILGLAARFLAEKMSAVRTRSREEERRMKLDSARLQQHLARHILDGYDPTSAETSRKSRQALRGQLAIFWQAYHRLVIAPIIALGGDPKKISHELSWGYVLQMQKGVTGMVATAIMARDSGWEVSFPTPEEDVKSGIDLIVKKDDKQIPLQIKCRDDTRFQAGPDSINRTMVDVCVPSPDTARTFYLDPELGIPNRSHSVDFDRAVNNLMTRKAA